MADQCWSVPEFREKMNFYSVLSLTYVYRATRHVGEVFIKRMGKPDLCEWNVISTFLVLNVGLGATVGWIAIIFCCCFSKLSKKRTD